MRKKKTSKAKEIILSALAEHEEEHGYFILAAEIDVEEKVDNFTVSLRIEEEHGYFILAIPL